MTSKMLTSCAQINPDAGHLGGKVGFIFFGLGSISAVLGYFYYPETKGVRFEKLDELYAAGVSPRHFKKMAQHDTTDSVIGAKEVKGVNVETHKLDIGD